MLVDRNIQGEHCRLLIWRKLGQTVVDLLASTVGALCLILDCSIRSCQHNGTHVPYLVFECCQSLVYDCLLINDSEKSVPILHTWYHVVI